VSDGLVCQAAFDLSNCIAHCSRRILLQMPVGQAKPGPTRCNGDGFEIPNRYMGSMNVWMETEACHGLPELDDG